MNALRLGVAAIAAVAATALGVAVLALPFAAKLAEWGAERYLSAVTETPVDLHVAALGPNGAVAEAFSAGEELRADRVVLSWTLSDLLRGRIAQMTVSGARLPATADSGGVSLGVVNRLVQPGEQGLHIERLALEDSVLNLRGPWGETAAPITLDLARDHLKASAVLGPEARLDITAIPRQDGALAGQAELRLPAGRTIAEFVSDNGSLAMKMHEPARFRLDTVPAWLAAAIPDSLRPAVAAPIALTVAGLGETPARLTLTPVVDGIAVSAALSAEAGMGEATLLRLELDGSALFQAGGLPQRLDVPHLTVEVRTLPLGTAQVDGVLRLGDIAGGPSSVAGEARLHVVGRRLQAAGAAIEQAAVSLNGRLSLDQELAAFTLAEPGRLYLEGLRLGQTLRTTRPASFSIGVGSEPAVRVSLSGDRGPALLPSVPFAGDIRLAIVDAGLDLTVPAGHLGGSWSLSDGQWHPVITGDGIAAQAEAVGLAARGIDLVYAADDHGARGKLRIAELRRRGGGRDGLALSGNAEIASAGDHLAFSAALTGAGDRVRLTLDGRHEPASGRGNVNVHMPTVTFDDGLRPVDLFPALAGELGDATGSIAVNGTVVWTDKETRPDLKVVLRDYTGIVGGVGVQRLNTAVRLNGLAPLASPADQQLAVALIDAGLPLVDGQMRFRLSRGRLAVQSGITHLAGGTVHIGPTILDPNARRQRVVLGVERVDLSALVGMIGLDGLDATGRLTGSIPLVLGGESAAIDGAKLHSTVPGVLRYRPRDAPAGLVGAGESMELLLKALNDFRYNQLSMTLNGRAGGELIATMKITGANPDLYGGYPIEFNLNVGGKLGTILDDAVSSYQIPDKIRERMSEYGAR